MSALDVFKVKNLQKVPVGEEDEVVKIWKAALNGASVQDHVPFERYSDGGAQLLKWEVKKSSKIQGASTTWDQEKATRFVCISDTHGKHMAVQVPPGDVLIHAGDITTLGQFEQLDSFLKWFAAFPHSHKIVIAGNHDVTLDDDFVDTDFAQNVYRLTKEDGDAARKLFAGAKDTGITFLEDSGVTIDGYNIYGAPWTPEVRQGKREWGFSLKRGPAMFEKWAKIPADTDVLISHGPGFGFGDKCVHGEVVGCVDLRFHLQCRVRPLVHIFGHIHETHGCYYDEHTTYVNPSSCSVKYKPVQPPIVFDLPKKRQCK